MFSADVIFLADASKHVDWNEFKRQKQVINYLARLLNVKRSGSRGALITYGDRPVININFDSYNNLDDFQRHVDSSPLIDGTRNIEQTMETVAQLVKRARSETPKIVVLLINGRQLPESNTFRNFTKVLRDLGAKMFVIATSSSRNYHNLENVLENPNDVMTFVNFKDVLSKGPDVSSYISSRKC